MEKILKLEHNDDITAIRSRIDFLFPPLAPEQTPAKAEKRRLLLIIPRKNKALHSLVNMKLLARAAQAKGVELAIVSGQPTVRDYAKEVGLKAFGNAHYAKWAGWMTSNPPVASAGETTPPLAVAEPEAGPADVVKGKKSPAKRKGRQKYTVVQGSGRVGCFQQLVALLALLALAFVLVLGALALLPEATVTLTPVAKVVETRMVVKADPEAKDVDFQNLTFPARKMQVELELDDAIETIDTELGPVGYSQGTVIFVNRTPDEQVIPISTTLSTSVGEQILFSTAQTVTIPAGIDATVSTTVVAMEPGPKGNARAGQINRFAETSYALLARVVNEQPFTGGSVEPTRIVVPADKERLQAHLQQKIQQEGLKQLQAQLGEQEFIPPESLAVIVLDINYNEFAGDFSDTFSGEMQAVVRGTVVGGYNANRLALAALQAQVPPGYDLDIDGLHFGAGEVLDVQENGVTFRVFANGKAVPKIDPLAVADEIAWLPVGEAQALLSQHYDLAAVPGVDLYPAWALNYVGRLPFVPLRINVVVNDAVSLMAEGN
jgi:hypothetical protein